MSTTNEKAKADFMETCIKEGHDKDFCERAWNDAKVTIPPTPKVHDASYSELAKELEMVKIERDRYKNQLRQSIDILQRANDKEKARDEAEKERLVMSIMQDSKYAKETLTTKTLDELRTIRTAIDHATEKTFASVAADMDAAKTPKRKLLTVGEWDPETKTWRGGN